MVPGIKASFFIAFICHQLQRCVVEALLLVFYSVCKLCMYGVCSKVGLGGRTLHNTVSFRKVPKDDQEAAVEFSSQISFLELSIRALCTLSFASIHINLELS